jgi:predicted kinase
MQYLAVKRLSRLSSNYGEMYLTIVIAARRLCLEKNKIKTEKMNLNFMQAAQVKFLRALLIQDFLHSLLHSTIL